MRNLALSSTCPRPMLRATLATYDYRAIIGQPTSHLTERASHHGHLTERVSCHGHHLLMARFPPSRRESLLVRRIRPAVPHLAPECNSGTPKMAGNSRLVQFCWCHSPTRPRRHPTNAQVRGLFSEPRPARAAETAPTSQKPPPSGRLLCAREPGGPGIRAVREPSGLSRWARFPLVRRGSDLVRVCLRGNPPQWGCPAAIAFSEATLVRNPAWWRRSTEIQLDEVYLVRNRA